MSDTAVTRVVLLTSPSLMGAAIIQRLAAEPGLKLVGVGLTNRAFKNTGLLGTIWRVVRRSGWAYFRYAVLESTISWLWLQRRGQPAVLKQGTVPSHAVNEINSDETLQWLQSCQPDILISFYFNQWIGPEVRRVAPRGCYNVHPSLLPALRGPDPVFRALERGLPESGITIHEVADEFDAGRIVHQARCAIDPAATHLANLWTLITRGADLVAGWISGRTPAAGAVVPTPVADYETFPKRSEVRRFLKAGHRLYRGSELRQILRSFLSEQ